MRPLMPRKGPSERPKATELPRLLKAWMDENGYRLEDVANALGLKMPNGITTVSRWRSGKMAPQPANERELARLIGVEISDFYPPGTFGPRTASVDALREIIEELASRFDLAEEDLLDRIQELTERVGTNEQRIAALIDQLRAQGMAELRALGGGRQTQEQEFGEHRKPDRSSEGSSLPEPNAE